jgi:hypothetical protein
MPTTAPSVSRPPRVRCAPPVMGIFVGSAPPPPAAVKGAQVALPNTYSALNSSPKVLGPSNTT